MIVELVREFRFEAAHLLPYVPEGHKCKRLHGHSFQCEIAVRGEVDERMGWFMDYAQITAAFDPIHAQLNHYYLNEVPGLQNPTAENLARWIWERLKSDLPSLSRVTIRETCTSSCHYFGEL